MEMVQDLEDQLDNQRLVIVELLSGQPRKVKESKEEPPRLPSKLSDWAAVWSYT